MTETVTRCPQCGTAFKVTLEQLESAKGAVRCGSCLQVFMARDNIVDQPSLAPSHIDLESNESFDLNEDSSESTSSQTPEPLYTAASNPGLAEQYTEADELSSHMDAIESLQPTSVQDQDRPSSNTVITASSQLEAANEGVLEPEFGAGEATDEEAANQAADDFQAEPIAADPPQEQEPRLESLDLESQDDELRVLEPQVLESQDDELRGIEPQDIDPRALDPQDIEPQVLEPQDDDPRDIDPQDLESQGDELRDIDPLDIESQDDELRGLEPQDLESQDGEPLDNEERFIDDASESNFQDSGNQELESLEQAFKFEDTSSDVFDDEAWARDILSELETDDKDSLLDDMSRPQKPSIFDRAASDKAAEQRQVEDQRHGLDLGDEPVDIQLGDDDGSHQPDSSFDNSEYSDDSEIEQKEELLNNIRPEPIELQYKKPELNSRWLWSVGCALALICIGVQVAYHAFDHYSRVEPYRQWYGNACSLLGCQLPPKQDLQQIKAYNLVIRSHPSVDQALSVDLVILNTSTFNQDFPALRLSFSNDNNKIVASRKFQPKDYLAGELAGTKYMPTQQPIHLSLNILDPGENAINYQIEPVLPSL